MKNRRNLKMVLMILICIVISLVGLIGIYSKNANIYSNKLPRYQLASDLKGETILELEVDNSTNTVYYDAEGKGVDSSEVTEENENQYTSKEEKVNQDENLTTENYEQTLQILKERLKFLKVDQYKVDLDKNTGKIVLSFEDQYPEDIESILPMEGKLELIDSKTSDVIITNEDIKSAEATYAATTGANNTNTYEIYMNLKLNDSGIEKINHIEGYKNSTDDNGEVTTNNFKVEFDKDELKEVSYDNMLLTGKTLRITLASDLTSNSTINSELNTASVVAKLVSIGRTPVVYHITAEEYVNANNVDEIVTGMMIISAILLVMIAIYFIIKYKLNGLLATIATITNIALFLILIRLTNISISLNSFAGMIGLIIMNAYLVSNLLKAIKNNTDKTIAENVKTAYWKTIDVITITLILFVVFAFSGMTVINSMGLFFFWGWIVVLLGNLLFTVPMLAIRNSK